MTERTSPRPRTFQIFLLDRAKKRPLQFSPLHPEVVSSAEAVRQSVAKATKDTLWVSYERGLTDILTRTIVAPSRVLGKAILLHALDPRSLPALLGRFRRLSFSTNNGFLPPDELAEALSASNAADLFIGGAIDSGNQTVTLWRANLEPLTVPFSTFPPSGDGIQPDFEQFSVTDFGQTIRLGDYEAATDAVLYEFDPDYRRRIAKKRQQSEQSFGASIRRLRNQRGLRREDFEPDVSAKEIARIEQSKIKKVHQATLVALARHLQVKPEDIKNY
jgi:DNA-binding Xre family transcriptional regulator